MRDGSTDWRWSKYGVEPEDERPGRLEVGDDGEVLDAALTGPVVTLGAICGLRTRPVGHARSQSFWVSEFAQLDSGRRVILQEGRGFTIGLGWGDNSVQDGLTREMLTQNVMNVLLPDDVSEEPHPWLRLAELARGRGLNVSAEDLSALPYHVVFTDSVTLWLQSP